MNAESPREIAPPHADERTSARFAAKISPISSGCWLWTGAIQKHGYGIFSFQGKCRLAHRVAYEIFKGPIPDGLTIDHACRIRNCVNPAHLRPMTNAENVRIGVGPSAIHAKKTECPRGHSYTPENTYEYRGSRYCKACAHAKARSERAVAQRKEYNRRPKVKARRHAWLIQKKLKEIGGANGG